MLIPNFIFKILPRKTFRIWQNKYASTIATVSIFSFILIWVLWLWKMTNLGQIYSPLFGAQSFGNLSAFSLPVFSTIILILNLYLAQLSYPKERMAGYFLLSAGLLVQILTLVLIRFYLAFGF